MFKSLQIQILNVYSLVITIEIFTMSLGRTSSSAKRMTSYIVNLNGLVSLAIYFTIFRRKASLQLTNSVSKSRFIVGELFQCHKATRASRRKRVLALLCKEKYQTVIDKYFLTSLLNTTHKTRKHSYVLESCIHQLRLLTLPYAINYSNIFN